MCLAARDGQRRGGPRQIQGPVRAPRPHPCKLHLFDMLPTAQPRLPAQRGRIGGVEGRDARTLPLRLRLGAHRPLPREGPDKARTVVVRAPAPRAGMQAYHGRPAVRVCEGPSRHPLDVMTCARHAVLPPCRLACPRLCARQVCRGRRQQHWKAHRCSGDHHRGVGGQGAAQGG